MKRKFLVLLLCILMVASIMPMGVFAQDGGESEILDELKDELAARSGYWNSAANGGLRTLDPEHFTRIAGKDRFETALLIAEEARDFFDGKLINVIVASGMDYPDALGASVLSYEAAAPILLVNSNNLKEIAQYIGKNLKDYDVETGEGIVFIMGGTGAVPASMETELASAGIDGSRVVRFAGSDRFDTNLKVMKYIGYAGPTIVCSGKNYADALSASAIGAPILLVGDKLTEAQKEYIVGQGLSKFLILGGEGAVSPTVENELNTIGSAYRLAGTDRYQTSKAFAEMLYAKTDFMTLTYGMNFPDGLSGCTICFMGQGPMFLATTAQIKPAADYAKAAEIQHVVILGGPTLISDEAAQTLIQ
ncbi:MAG: cell wall-binding repeat-containing protein [Firmicutes bacterium]|nr:cell wall-binding repeat-containing protein [Bacillota bacterium]